MTTSYGDPFTAVRDFMTACGQTVDKPNEEQTTLYHRLVAEEAQETQTAISDNDDVEIVDGICDMIVVLIGYAYSRGYDIRACMAAVLAANDAKVDPATGQVRRRADGKVLKPDGWVSPNKRIAEILHEQGFTVNIPV